MALDQALLNQTESEALDKIVRQWAGKTVGQLKQNIQKLGLVVDGELLNSIEYSIVPANPPYIQFRFAAHGKYLDMKTLFWTKTPPFQSIFDWVKKQPINEWSYVPGYEHRGQYSGVGDMDPEMAQRRIAWGIMRSRASGEFFNQYSRWKRKKRWQTPSGGKKGRNNLGTSIGHLRHLLEEGLAAQIEKELVHAIEKGNGS